MYCLYVGVDYTYIDITELALGIKSFLASQVWFHAVAGAQTYGTDVHMYVCKYLIMNERTGSGILIKKVLFFNFVPGIWNWFLFWPL